MYPRNSETPPPFTVGRVIQKTDGAEQTADVLARVKTGTGAWGAAAGTLAVDATSGAWEYTPTQAETDAETFSVAIYKTGCIGASVTIATVDDDALQDAAAAAIAAASLPSQSQVIDAVAAVVVEVLGE